VRFLKGPSSVAGNGPGYRLRPTERSRCSRKSGSGSLGQAGGASDPKQARGRGRKEGANKTHEQSLALQTLPEKAYVVPTLCCYGRSRGNNAASPKKQVPRPSCSYNVGGRLFIATPLLINSCSSSPLSSERASSPWKPPPTLAPRVVTRGGGDRV
jgi:hypothetical protein